MDTLIYNHTVLEVAVFGTGGVLWLFTAAATFLLMHRHLKYYADPTEQTYILRILALPVVYASHSLFAVLFFQYAVYMCLIRDCYEAFVLYQFFSLLVYYFNRNAPGYFSTGTPLSPIRSVGTDFSDDSLFETEVTASSPTGDTTMYIQESGDGGTEYDSNEEEDETRQSTSMYLSRVDMARHPIPCCCVTLHPGLGLFIRIRRGVLQYAGLKMVLSLLAVMLQPYGLYGPGSFNPARAYLWLSLIQNVSVMIALYSLMLFYMLVHHIIKQHRPLAKLMAMKLVLFMLFWQSVLVACLYYTGLVPSLFQQALGGPEQSASVINNLLICIEMAVLALAHFYVYPYDHFKEAAIDYVASPRGEMVNALSGALNPIDLLKDSANIISGKDEKIV